MDAWELDAVMMCRFARRSRGPLLLGLALAIGGAASLAPLAANAQTPKKTAADPQKKPKPDPKGAKKPSPDKAAGKPAGPDTGAGKPSLLGSFGDWGAYAAGAGKAKTCYSLAKPKERQPASLKRDPGYVFISNRPGESVANEVSFVMGFEVKADSAPKAEIGAANFDLVAKGSNLWVKNAAEEGQFVEAMRKGQRLVVKATSKKGNLSTDTYALAGVAQALERARKECE